MSHILFYKDQEFGYVENPLNIGDHVWICERCSQIFARRKSTENHGPFAGPFRWTVWKSLCADCLKLHPNYQDERFTANFRFGGDKSDQLPVLRAQFLYDSTFLLPKDL